MNNAIFADSDPV